MNQQGGPQQRQQGPPNPQQFQQQRPQNPNPPIINRGPAPQQMPPQNPQMPQNRPPITVNQQPNTQPYQPNKQPIVQTNPSQMNPQPANQQPQQQPIQRPPLIRPQQVPPNYNTHQPLQPSQQQSQNISSQQPVNIQPNMPYRQSVPQAVAQQRPVPIGPNITSSRPAMAPYGSPPTMAPYGSPPTTALYGSPKSQPLLLSQSQKPLPHPLRSQNSLERIQRPIDAAEISARTEPSRPNSVLSNKSDEDHRASVPKPSVPNSYQHPPLQRNDSRNSIPSRPQSSMEHQSKSPSPDYMTKPMEMRPAEHNLPKIPENVNRNVYESRDIRESVNVPRPPSVTFKEDVKKYPIESKINEQMKSPISLNTIINSDGAPSPGYKSRDIDRTTTPTSEKFRPMPGLAQERPPGYVNGGDAMRLKSSLKYSKIILIEFSKELL